MKTVYLLVGPKGSGKTYIGSLLERALSVPFLRVEAIWLALQPGEDGWRKVEERIRRVLTNQDEVIIESLGAGEGFLDLRDTLARDFRLVFIKVTAAPDECLRRVKQRNASEHLPVSEADLVRFNAIAEKVQHPWSGIIDNNRPAADEEILDTFQRCRAGCRGSLPGVKPPGPRR